MEKNQRKRQVNNEQQSVQNQLDNLEAKEGRPAQEDGFRYDYDDSSDLKK